MLLPDEKNEAMPSRDHQKTRNTFEACIGGRVAKAGEFVGTETKSASRFGMPGVDKSEEGSADFMHR